MFGLIWTLMFAPPEFPATPFIDPVYARFLAERRQEFKIETAWRRFANGE